MYMYISQSTAHNSDSQLIDIIVSVTIAGPPILDANARAASVSNVGFTVEEVHNGSSVYN